LNPGRRGGKLATNRLSYGTINTHILCHVFPPNPPSYDKGKIYTKQYVSEVCISCTCKIIQYVNSWLMGINIGKQITDNFPCINW
jgi:hypothetical protein